MPVPSAPVTIETLENRFKGRDYLVDLGAPEFTSICPMTGGPDFGELTIRYVPDEKLFELKSLRDYLTGFRERQILQEEVVNEVLEQLGLVPALEWLAERIEERTNVTVELDVRGDGAARIQPDVELHVYRIAQQALDNALVHARPSKIRISIDMEADRLDLEVVDDGAGILPEAEGRALRAGRVGIADMRQRAAAIGAAFRIGRRDGGTAVAVRWPA